jgi:hypothetical protein
MDRVAVLVILLILLFFILLVIMYLSRPGQVIIPEEASCENPDDVAYRPAQVSVEPGVTAGNFVPSEDRIVPTHASYSNKFNDVIGNEKSGIIGKGIREASVTGDWYMSSQLPTYFDGEYWPRGTIEPDFIYDGSDPDKRALRKQDWPTWYRALPGA